MVKTQSDSLYIPSKAQQHAYAIRQENACTDMLSFDWMESAVNHKVWRATRSWKFCTRW